MGAARGAVSGVPGRPYHVPATMTSIDDPPPAPPDGDPAPPPDVAAPGDLPSSGGSPVRRLERRRAERRVRTERRHGKVAAVVSGTGRVLITAGLLVLGFVAFQLWGTNLLNAREQRELRDEFTDQLAEAGLQLPDGVPTADDLAAAAANATSTSTPTTTAATTPVTAAPAPTTTSVVLPPGLTPELGEAVAAVQIPSIGVEQFVVEGVTRDDLRKGPGHYPSTPLPGQPGNAAIAGHRTTHGAPFNQLDELATGDPIVVTTLNGIYTYRVTESFVVDPSDVSVLDPVVDADAALENTLTLTTCTPEFSARQRLVIRAELVPGESSPLTGPGAPTDEQPAALPGDDATTTTVDDTTGTTAAGATATTTTPTATTAPAPIDHGAETVEELEAFSAPGTAFYLLGLVVALVGAAWWWAFRQRRRVTTWVAGVLPFVVVLFLFYVQVELILPAGY
jgi:sortase A